MDGNNPRYDPRTSRRRHRQASTDEDFAWILEP